MVPAYQSPNGTAAPQAQVLVPEVDEILEMVDTHERDSEVLRSRMDGDSGLYRLEEHVNRDPVTKEILKNYATFTSSSPRSYADKVISWLGLAGLGRCGGEKSRRILWGAKPLGEFDVSGA